jgi:acyl-CoA thioesterase II
MSAESQLPEILQSEQVDERRFRFGCVDAEGRDVVFGGQLLAQIIMAAGGLAPGKEVKTVHAVFARAGTITQPIDIEVEPVHSGRTFASDTATVWQGDRLRARAQVLLHAPEPDLIRDEAPMPSEPSPEEGNEVGGSVFPGAEMRVVRGTGDSSPGPAELAFWTRYAEAPGDILSSQAILSWATNGLLIGTAMRPHGLNLADAHRSISTGVISNTLTFHDHFDARDWLLLTHDIPYTGRGRVYGRGEVFTHDGRFVASFVQDAMVRGIPEGTSLDRRSAM